MGHCECSPETTVCQPHLEPLPETDDRHVPPDAVGAPH